MKPNACVCTICVRECELLVITRLYRVLDNNNLRIFLFVSQTQHNNSNNNNNNITYFDALCFM